MQGGCQLGHRVSLDDFVKIALFTAGATLILVSVGIPDLQERLRGWGLLGEADRGGLGSGREGMGGVCLGFRRFCLRMGRGSELRWSRWRIGRW